MPEDRRLVAARRNWSEEEVQKALALYLRLDFGKFHSRNPQVISLGEMLGRTSSAVALKLTNLAALDDSLPQKGMANASRTDRRVWAEFLHSPDAVLRAYEEQTHAQGLPTGFAERRAAFEARQDEVHQSQQARRLGQGFFREMILTSYQSRCALIGLDSPKLLTASHIVGWAEDSTARLNPSNGICLNALHDRAFDRHLITFDDDLRMIIAPDLPEATRRQLIKGAAERLAMPSRFLPDPGFLSRHRARFHARLD